MRNKLHQFTSAFPGGWPGVGLLLLRVEIGLTAVIQGWSYIDREISTIGTWSVGLLGIVGGLSLLIGFMTPLASTIVGLATICIAVSSISGPASIVFNTIVPTVLVVVVAAAIVLLGPGALSLDARRFGRREIIIPRTSAPSRS